MSVEAVALERAAWIRDADDGGLVRLGYSLRQLRERFAGEEGEICDPWGTPHPLSLAPWADADPDATWLNVEFKAEPEYALERDTQSWREVQRTAWMSVEGLVENGFSRARVVMVNDTRGWMSRCRRGRAIGRRVLAAAHGGGCRDLAVEALDATVAAELSAARVVPAASGGVLAEDDMRAMLQDALDRGWDVWGFAVDLTRYPGPATGADDGEWRQRQCCAHLDDVLGRLGHATKLLVWYEGASMTLWGPHFDAAAIDDVSHCRFSDLTWDESFVVDQTCTIAFYAESERVCANLVESTRPVLESFGGSAAILHEDAGEPLRYSACGCHAFLLSTENALDATVVRESPLR